MVGLTGSGTDYAMPHGQSPAIRDGLDRFLLATPVLGSILERAAVARFSRTLATTFGADVPLVEGLRSAAGAAGNAVFETPRLPEERGHDGYGPRRRHERQPSRWPSMLRQMVLIGEQGWAVDDMLDKAAAHYEQEVDNAVESLTELLENPSSRPSWAYSWEPDLGHVPTHLSS